MLSFKHHLVIVVLGNNMNVPQEVGVRDLSAVL